MSRLAWLARRAQRSLAAPARAEHCGLGRPPASHAACRVTVLQPATLCSSVLQRAKASCPAREGCPGCASTVKGLASCPPQEGGAHCVPGAWRLGRGHLGRDEGASKRGLGSAGSAAPFQPLLWYLTPIVVAARAVVEEHKPALRVSCLERMCLSAGFIVSVPYGPFLQAFGGKKEEAPAAK